MPSAGSVCQRITLSACCRRSLFFKLKGAEGAAERADRRRSAQIYPREH